MVSFLVRRKKTSVALILLSCILVLYLGWALRLKQTVADEEVLFEAAGYSLDLNSLNDVYPAVSDEDNAALVILAAESLMAAVPPRLIQQIREFESDSKDPSSWTDTHRDDVAEFVKTQRPFLDAVALALDKPESRYPVDLSAGFDMRLFHLRLLRDAAEVGQRAAALAVHEGDGEEALRMIRIMVMLSDSIRNEPLMISRHNRTNLDLLVVQTVLEVLYAGILSVEQLTNLHGTLQSVPDTVSADMVLAIEATLAYSYLAYPKKRSIAFYSGDSIVDNLLYEQLPILGYALDSTTRKYDRARYQYLSFVNHLIAAIRRPPAESASDVQRVSNEFFSERRIDVVAMMLPNVGYSHRIAVESKAIRNAAANAVAVERFRLENGRLPHTLDEVESTHLGAIASDELTGGPYIYAQNRGEVRIYSPGVDGLDNGGYAPPGSWAVIDRTVDDAGVMVHLGMNDRETAR